jgi:hypothetical protein
MLTGTRLPVRKDRVKEACRSGVIKIEEVIIMKRFMIPRVAHCGSGH